MDMENVSSQYQTSPPIVSHQRKPQGKLGKIVFMLLCCVAIREATKSRHTGRNVGKWKIICACVVEKHGKNHRLQITQRLQFPEVCYGAILEHLQLWCHVSHCISFECVFECVLFVPEKHPSRCLVCPWSRPWRLRPQTPWMRNVPTTTEKVF